MPIPAGPLASSILLWTADELRDPPAAPCCLRSTRAGSRAAVYRTGPGGGVAALVDFAAHAEAGPDGGWCAEGVVHLLDGPLPRSVLLADDELGPVFRHLRGRRRLPAPAARRLSRLLRNSSQRPHPGGGPSGLAVDAGLRTGQDLTAATRS